MIQSYQNLFGLESLAARPQNLSDVSSLLSNADNPSNPLLTSPSEQSNSFASYLQTLQTKYREDSKAQSATSVQENTQNDAKPVNEVQPEVVQSGSREQNPAGQVTDKQSDEKAADPQEKPERRALTLTKKAWQVEGKSAGQTENKTITTGPEKIALTGSDLSAKAKVQNAELQDETKTARAEKAGKLTAKDLSVSAKRETGKKSLADNEGPQIGESLAAAGKSASDKKLNAPNLQPELEKAKQNLQHGSDAKKTEAVGQKEERAARLAHKVVVVDLRTPEQIRPQEQSGRISKQQQKNNDKKEALHRTDSVPSGAALHNQNNGVASREAVLPAKELTKQGQSEDGGHYALFRSSDNLNHAKEQPVTFTGTGPNSPFAERLNAALQNEVLKNTSFVVKNDGNGEIRLVLKPESLGQIRIKISINNNHLDGRIIVENNTIREIVEENLKNLDQAFRDAGFATTSLGVSVGQEQNGQGSQTGSMPEYRPANDRVAHQFENNLGRMEAIQLDSLINMMA